MDMTRVKYVWALRNLIQSFHSSQGFGIFCNSHSAIQNLTALVDGFIKIQELSLPDQYVFPRLSTKLISRDILYHHPAGYGQPRGPPLVNISARSELAIVEVVYFLLGQ